MLVPVICAVLLVTAAVMYYKGYAAYKKMRYEDAFVLITLALTVLLVRIIIQTLSQMMAIM